MILSLFDLSKKKGEEESEYRCKEIKRYNEVKNGQTINPQQNRRKPFRLWIFSNAASWLAGRVLFQYLERIIVHCGVLSGVPQNGFAVDGGASPFTGSVTTTGLDSPCLPHPLATDSRHARAWM